MQFDATGGAGGPRITVNPADVAVYQSDLASGGSVVTVQAGEQLTERQALEALLLASGNNIATLVAAWDAGSQVAFVAKMNAQARALGLLHTHYTGASGVETSTVSTAGDQVRLAMRALSAPAFAETVGASQATLPVAGTQYNKDVLLGKDGIIGIKPGTTSEAGGCFLFAADAHTGGRSVTVVGAVLHQMGAGTQASMLASAFAASTTLLDSTRRVLVTRRVLRRGSTLAWLSAPWTHPLALQAGGSASLVGWPGLPVRTTVAVAQPLHAPVAADQDVGSAVVSAGGRRETVRLVPAGALPDAPLTWRLRNP